MDIEDEWFLDRKPPDPVDPLTPPSEAKPSMRRLVTWDATVFGADTDMEAIFAAIRGILNPAQNSLLFSVSQESGPTVFYPITREMIATALAAKED